MSAIVECFVCKATGLEESMTHISDTGSTLWFCKPCESDEVYGWLLEQERLGEVPWLP